VMVESPERFNRAVTEFLSWQPHNRPGAVFVTAPQATSLLVAFISRFKLVTAAVSGSATDLGGRFSLSLHGLILDESLVYEERIYSVADTHCWGSKLPQEESRFAVEDLCLALYFPNLQ